MPAILNKEATCLVCGHGIVATAKTFSPGSDLVTVEFMHEAEIPDCTKDLGREELLELEAEGRV